jgi:hypothetical protein
MNSPSQDATVEAITDLAWEAIQGAYDLQVHVAPDVIARRTDDVDLARDFLGHGLRGFVLKSHYIPTAERAKVVARAVPGIKSYGAIALNHSVGGLNPVAVEIAGRSDNQIVWMPTVDAANETAGRPEGGNEKLPFWATIQREIAAAGITRPPITVLEADGRISEDARQCLELIAKHNMILATGHLGRHEIFPLVRMARQLGVQKIIITHAEFPSQNLTGDEQAELARLGAIIEHCFTTYHTNKAPWEVVYANIRQVGVERSMLSTDLGQATNPPVAEGFAMYAQRLLDAGFTAAEINHMSAIVPANLLE